MRCAAHTRHSNQHDDPRDLNNIGAKGIVNRQACQRRDSIAG